MSLDDLCLLPAAAFWEKSKARREAKIPRIQYGRTISRHLECNAARAGAIHPEPEPRETPRQFAITVTKIQQLTIPALRMNV